MTFLSVVTRCHPHRPTMLDRNQESLEMQTDQDYEHVLIKDTEGRGVPWANAQLQYAEVTGEYVLVLDDDDMLTDPHAIATLKTAAANGPALIIFKADHGPLGILPSRAVWEQRPVSGHIGSCDFITRRDVWREHISAFDKPECGDYAFLKSAWGDGGLQVVWLDATLAGVQRVSKGAAE
jgi:hypothetical protein